jgi:hypothetical protein
LTFESVGLAWFSIFESLGASSRQSVPKLCLRPVSLGRRLAHLSRVGMYWRGLSRERDYVANWVVLLPKPKVAGSMPVARFSLQV